MPNSYYPTRITDLPPWHTNLSVQAVASGVSHGLTAGIVSQIGTDKDFVIIIVNNLEAVDDYAQAITAYKEAVFNSPIGTVLPMVPALPPLILVPLAALSAIKARTTIQYVPTIKGSAGYDDAVGELYGIVAPAPGPAADPAIQKATPLVGTSSVMLDLFKGGYDVIAIDMQRAGGAWVQIGISQTGTFTDMTAALVAGQPEARNFRCQGMLNNARTGGMSPTVSAVTVP